MQAFFLHLFTNQKEYTLKLLRNQMLSSCPCIYLISCPCIYMTISPHLTQ